LANDYFPRASQYIPYMDTNRKATVAGRYPSGRDFDYGSIMIYGSARGGARKISNPEQWVLVRKGEEVARPICTGGSEDENKAGISIHDVLKVAWLYPAGKDPAENAEIQRQLQKPVKEQTWDDGSPIQRKTKHLIAEQRFDDVQVNIPGLISTVVQALPPDVAEVPPLVGSSETQHHVAKGAGDGDGDAKQEPVSEEEAQSS